MPNIINDVIQVKTKHLINGIQVYLTIGFVIHVPCKPLLSSNCEFCILQLTFRNCQYAFMIMTYCCIIAKSLFHIYCCVLEYRFLCQLYGVLFIFLCCLACNIIGKIWYMNFFLLINYLILESWINVHVI